MRSIWSGVISVGLINIPVQLYSAVSERSLDLDYLDRRDLAPIRYVRVNARTGEEVPFRDIVRGYEYRKGDYVVLGDADLEKAVTEKTRRLAVERFVDEREIDPELIERPYYLEPSREAGKGYALFREALVRSGKTAVVRFVLKRREHLGFIRAEGRLLVLIQMRFQSEVKSPAGLDTAGMPAVSENELSLALDLVEQLSGPFRPHDYRDTYSEELKKVIAARAQGKAHAVRRRTEEPTKTTDLLEKLRESLEYAQRK